MKLVAAAKVRRAQEAVISGRPFSENLIKVRRRCAAAVIAASLSGPYIFLACSKEARVQCAAPLAVVC